MTSDKQTIAIARGDGIGPEIMDATLKVIEAAGCNLQFEDVNIGKTVFESGYSAGITSEAWETIRKNKNFLKAPITTPQGGGYKSLNVTIRKALSLFANVRPCKAYSPFVHSNFPNMDMVIVRENEEDLYGGIEYQHTNEVAESMKLISRPGSENVVRYAFEYAKVYGRNKVTCMTKDNIMKQTDGLFHQVFDEIAKEYPDIESEHRIIDIGAAEIATKPDEFDVIVTLNLYGDIISDIAAQLTGSVGLAGSANIGLDCAMFEAIHGSAPDISGKDVANPSGLLNGALMMLRHINMNDKADLISNAWMKTLEDGIHTPDIYKESDSKQKVGTQGFAEAVAKRIGEKPAQQKAADDNRGEHRPVKIPAPKPVHCEKKLVGVDVYVHWEDDHRNPDKLAKALDRVTGEYVQLQMITNRGTKVYPDGAAETFKSDHWRCRFMAEKRHLSHEEIIDLLKKIDDAGLDFIKVEHLYEIDGQRAYSLAQGE